VESIGKKTGSALPGDRTVVTEGFFQSSHDWTLKFSRKRAFFDPFLDPPGGGGSPWGGPRVKRDREKRGFFGIFVDPSADLVALAMRR